MNPRETPTAPKSSGDFVGWTGSDAEKHLNDPMVIAKLQEVGCDCDG